MTQMPQLTMSYDVANRMTTSNHASAGTQVYGYNHANQRVFVRNGNTVTYYLYGLGGERLMEFQETCTSGACTSYTETQRRIYFAGRKMFSKTGTTLKAITPNRLASEAKHFPYGETDGTPPSDTKDYFATYRRDTTGLDYAWNRYYSPTMGRFTTADPYGGSATAADPNSWNRYAYASGDPLSRMDLDGLDDYHIDDITVFNPADPRNVSSSGTSVTVSASSGMTGSDYWFYTGSIFSWEKLFPREMSITDANADAERRGAKAAHRMEIGKAGCAIIPDGVVASGSASVGILGAPTGSTDILVNLNTLEVTAFGNGGMSTGVPFGGAGASGSASVGLVFGLGSDNTSFGGGSTTITGAGPSWGGFVSASTGGLTGLQEAMQAVESLMRQGGASANDYVAAISSLLPSAPFTVGATAGQGLLSTPVNLTATFSHSTSPLPLGQVSPSQLLAASPSAFLLYLVRQKCNE